MWQRVDSGVISIAMHFFDVRVFNPFARSNAGRFSSVYRRHEQEKRRIYQERIINVEHGTFTPFVMAATGGLDPAATVVCKRLVSLLAEKMGSP